MLHLQESLAVSETRDVREAPAEKTKPIIARLVSLLAKNDDDDLDTGEMSTGIPAPQPSTLTASLDGKKPKVRGDVPPSERIRLHWTSSALGKAALVRTLSLNGGLDEIFTFEFDARKGTVDYAMHSVIGQMTGVRSVLTLDDLEYATVLAETSLVTKKRLAELQKEAETKQDDAVLELFRSYLGGQTDGEWTFRDDTKGVLYMMNAGEADKIHFSAHIKNPEGQWIIHNATIDKATGRFLHGQVFTQDDVILGLMDRGSFLTRLRGMRQILNSVGYARA